jgi:Rps23 Pro-64 3,4-dihydroxylase Tpa1-like proline 4-hydroxylase
MQEATLPPPAQHRLAALMDRAVDTLEALLDDPGLPAERRADLALRMLDLVLAGETDAPPATPVSGLLPARCFAIPDFLSPDLHAAAVATALQLRDRFVASSVTSAEPGYRRSRVLYEDSLPTLYPAMRQEIMAVLPAVCTALVLPVFAPSHLELHMTVHGDGDFFKVHTDTAAPEIARRTISFAYYFIVRQPCGFSGGTLRLYETIDAEPPRHEPARFQDVTPADNMIVFFESRLLHEVLPLHVPSGTFEDGRFTLNGWLQR